jgi:preprotein translocase subunit SecA
MEEENLEETIADMREHLIEDLINNHIPARSYPDDWDTKGLSIESKRIFTTDFGLEEWAKEEGIENEAFYDRFLDAADRYMATRSADIGPEIMRQLERTILLQAIDSHWKDHLSQLDHLRQVIQLRAYGQRNPLDEYKTESFSMFENMLSTTRDNVAMLLAHVEFRREYDVPDLAEPDRGSMSENHTVNPPVSIAEAKAWRNTPRNAECPCGSGKKYKHCHGQVMPKVGRNDACPCRSGKKYKHCHGAL